MKGVPLGHLDIHLEIVDGGVLVLEFVEDVVEGAVEVVVGDGATLGGEFVHTLVLHHVGPQPHPDEVHSVDSCV